MFNAQFSIPKYSRNGFPVFKLATRYTMRIKPIIVITVLPFLTHAQPLSLQDALRIAQENRPELQAQALRMDIARNADAQVRGQWRPQVSGTADSRWNTQLQTNVLPIGSFGLPGVPADARREVEFGLPFNNILSVQAEQKVVDRNRAVDRQLHAAQVELERNTLEQNKLAVRYAVEEAYLAVLFHEERLRLAVQTLERNRLTLEYVAERYRNGRVLKNDLDRAVLDTGNAALVVRNIRHDRDLGLQTLCYRMHWMPESAPVLTARLEPLLAQAGALETEPAGERLELLAEALNLRLNTLQQRKQRLRRQPSVSAYANYALLQLHDQFNPFVGGTWFPYNFIGIRAQFPLYDGGQARHAAQDFVLRQQINQLNLGKLRADVTYEQTSARTALRQALADLEQSRRNLALAEQLYRTDQDRYQQGVLLQTDLKNTELSLLTAQNNYLSAVYQVLIARVGYRKAVGD